MANGEIPANSALLMDRGIPVGNSSDQEGRRALHVRQTAGKLVTKPFDYVAASYPTTTQEIYQFYLGGSGGTLQSTVTINYTDATKANISTVALT